MKPTKEYTGRSTIRMFNADCMEFMEDCDMYELAIVDPEYGIGEDGKKNHSRVKLSKPTKYKDKSWDKESVSKIKLDNILSSSKNQIIFGANHFISKIPYDSSCWIVWDKDNSGDFADAELAWTSFKTAVRIVKIRWNGMLQHDMKNKQIRIHPTEKPVKLYKWLLTNYATEGDTIIDTHGGSMSIAIACWDLGFDLDIIELDKDYFSDAVKRFENHISQTQLF